ncbi:MAG: Ribosomal protein L11 methyltransferase [Syntrophorhabdaceae bacterium PtaU1.Bin034]|nr:MAG: Ribosomal protein L11 methyltransferase [Syntrophorhabdaceae bacterium PtaU1.Bin034]
MAVARVDILAGKGTEELLESRFYSLCSGVWIESRGENVLIKCYPSDTGDLLAYLRDSNLPVVSITSVEEEEKDYVALVRKHFRPLAIGSLTVLPPWTKTGKKGHTLVIEPGMAFGTGRHESTKLMVKMMNDVNIEGKSVLDIGSGSGILALYASLLGASQVVAVDHDPLSTEAIRKSCDLNNVDALLIACAHLENIRGSFDVVLANLDFDTFSRYSAQVTERVGNGGYLIMSGIEQQYAGRIRPLFASFTLLKRRKMKDWYGFIFRR